MIRKIHKDPLKKIMRPRISLIVRNANGVAGTHKIYTSLAKFFKSKDWDVHLIADNVDPQLDSKQFKFYKTLRFPVNGKLQRHFFDLQCKIRNYFISPSLVVGHGDTLVQDVLFLHTCVHLQADYTNDAKLIKRNSSIELHRRILTEKKFKLLICNSKMMKEDVEMRFGITAPSFVLYPCLNPQEQNEIDAQVVNDLRLSLMSQGGDIIVGLVTSGNLENRGAARLIDACGKLPVEIKDRIALVIVGKDKNPGKYVDLALKNGLGKKLTWIRSRKDIQNVFSAIDIMVHPAKVEAFGMTVLEAMFHGVPIISSKTVGAAEVFGQLQKEFVTHFEDTKTISSLLLKLITDAKLRDRISKENREIASGYTWESYNANLQKMLLASFPELTMPNEL